MMTRYLQSGLLVLALGLAACSSGGGGSDTTSARGAVVKGPVQEAQVQLFALDEAGFAIGDAIQTLTTDATGRFTFSRPANGPALLAVTRGGSFVDESDPQTDPLKKRRITLTDQEGFESVLPAGATTLVVTPYTESLLLRARRAANGANFLIFFDAVRARAIEAFGFDPFSVIPEPPLTPDPAAPLEARRYALLLGGAALAIQTQASSLGTVPTYSTIRAFIIDFSDGRLDGQLNGDPVSVSDTEHALPTDVSLADAVLRFRNNNFAAYAELDASSIDESKLAEDLDLANQPPLARDDLFNTAEDVELVVSAPGVLTNDSDSEGQSLSVELLNGPAHGDLLLAIDGGFTYAPDTNFNGADTFTYRVSDGALLSAPATVSLTIGGLNDAPIAAAESFATDEDTSLSVSAPGVLGNDTDADDSEISAALITAPLNGVLVLNSDGAFTYTPDSNFSGSDTFTYRASDGVALSETVTVTLTVNPVNDPPSAFNNAFITNEDTPLSVPAPGVLGNDSDPEGKVLSAVLVSNPNSGTLSLNQDGSFSYAPATNFSGSTSFTYRAFDGTAQSYIATVTLTVNPVNDAPTALNNSYTTDEDTTLSVPAPGVLGNDSDPEGAGLTAVFVSSTGGGALSFNGNGGFNYAPDPEFSGSASFTYRAFDGSLSSNLATVSLTIRAINDPPQSTADSYSTPSDTSLVVLAPGVLDNDTDIDDATLTAVLVSGPNGGELDLNEDGSFVFTPSSEAAETASFTYRAFDGSLSSSDTTVTITLTEPENPLAAVEDDYTAANKSILVVPAPGVLDNDSPASGISVVSSTPPSAGNLGELAFQDDFSGDMPADSTSTLDKWTVSNFSFTVEDGSGEGPFVDEGPGSPSFVAVPSTVDVFQSGFGFNSNFVDLDGGTPGQPARLESNPLDLVAGDYVLAFTLGNNSDEPQDPNSMIVSVGGVEIGRFSREGFVAPVPVACSLNLPADVVGASIIFDHAIDEQSSDDAGLLIDDVTLVRLYDSEPISSDGSFVYVAPTYVPWMVESAPQVSSTDSFAYTIADDSDPAETDTADVSISGIVPGVCDIAIIAQ